MNASKPQKVKDIFVEGAIDPVFVGTSLAKHASRTDIGAHEIFLGQVRADKVDDRAVTAIEYTAYREMALERMIAIREEAFGKWPGMTCLHVYHSLGTIKAGDLCFMVFASAPHRRDARDVVAYVVDRIKAELPIFGREVVEGGGYVWKTNT